MKKIWLELEDSDADESFTTRFWRKHRIGVSQGSFWADEIKKYKDEPYKRLSLALENLPLPAAFRESMVALRKIIVAARKEGASFEEDLELLYRVGAVESMMLPYSERLKEPGYNVLESIPGGLLFKLAEPYQELGYARMKLFTKSDQRAFAEVWGSPIAHTTMNEKYHEVWKQYENKLLQTRRQSGFGL